MSGGGALAAPDNKYFWSNNTGKTFWRRPWVFGKRAAADDEDRVKEITLPGKGSEYMIMCVSCADLPRTLGMRERLR